MMKRIVAVLFAIAVLLVAGVASAHVTVWPKQSTANGFERYTVRVPNEKDIPTVKVRLELPPGATFSAVLPLPGWTFETEKDAAGKVTAMVWSGGEIRPGEFQEFGISVRNPKEGAEMVWKAYQTYSDGSVVEWTGAADSDHPASVTSLVAAGAPAPQAPAAPGAGTPQATPAPGAGNEAPAPQPTPAPAGGGGLGTWLGGGALLVSLVALVLALRK